jgi:hypothetical protein
MSRNKQTLFNYAAIGTQCRRFGNLESVLSQRPVFLPNEPGALTMAQPTTCASPRRDHAMHPTVVDLLCKPENRVKLALQGAQRTGGAGPGHPLQYQPARVAGGFESMGQQRIVGASRGKMNSFEPMHLPAYELGSFPKDSSVRNRLFSIAYCLLITVWRQNLVHAWEIRSCLSQITEYGSGYHYARAVSADRSGRRWL